MRTLRKTAIAVMMMIMVACGVYAESYAGFEVKEGITGIKVIVVKLSEDYEDPSAGKYDVEFPLEYYKDLENILRIFDEYMSMTEEEICMKYGESEMMELLTKSSEVLKAKKTYLNDNYEDAKDFMTNIEKVMTGCNNCMTMVKNGASFAMIEKKLTRKDKKNFYLVIEAFPSLKFSNLLEF